MITNQIANGHSKIQISSSGIPAEFSTSLVSNSTNSHIVDSESHSKHMFINNGLSDNHLTSNNNHNDINSVQEAILYRNFAYSSN